MLKLLLLLAACVALTTAAASADIRKQSHLQEVHHCDTACWVNGLFDKSVCNRNFVIGTFAYLDSATGQQATARKSFAATTCQRDPCCAKAVSEQSVFELFYRPGMTTPYRVALKEN